jgi:putative PEP-CTERM system TPR-repeat lipoprotein
MTDLSGKRRQTVRACLAIACALLIGACDGDASLSDVEYLQRAQAHIEAGDIAAGLIEARNAVQANPENAEARRLLGELFLLTGNPESAASQLERARRMGIEDETLDIQLARARLLQGEFEAVLAGLDAPESVDSASAAERMLLRGGALLATGETEAAREAFRQVVAYQPRADAYAGLARLALLDGDLDEVERLLAEGQALAPENAELLAISGELALRRGDPDVAESRFRQLLEAEEANTGARLGAARALIASERYEEAAVELDTVLAAAPDSVIAAYLRAVTAYELGDYAQAQAGVDRVLATVPDNVPALLLAGASAYALDQNEVALNHLNRALALDSGNIAVRRLLAAAQMRADLYDEALETLGPGLELGADDAELLTMAGIAALRSGNVVESGRLLGRAVEQSPEDAVARTRLGLLRLAEGEDRTAIEELEGALERQPDLVQAEILLILALVRNEQYDRAIERAETLGETRADSPIGPVLAGIAQAAAGDRNAAAAAFERALEVEPGYPDAGNNLALLALLDGDVDAARGYFDEVLTANPGHLATLVRLARLEASAGNPEAARAVVERAVEANPDSVEARTILARLLLTQGEPQEALNTVRPVLGNGEDRPALLLETAGLAQLGLGQTGEAVRTFQDLARQFPDRPVAQFRLAQAYEAAGDMRGVRTALERALELDDSYLDAKIAYGRLQLSEDRLEAAARTVAELRELAADDDRVADLEARVLLAEDRPEEAAEVLRAAVAEDPSPDMVRRLARTEWSIGERDAAVATMNEWIGGNPEDWAGRMVLADFMLTLEDLPAARDHYLAVLEAMPDNVVARNNVAWILSELGDLDAALEHAEAAYDAAGENPMVMDTLGMILLERGETDRAVALMADASAAAEGNPMIAAHYARSLAEAGRGDEAQAVLEEVLADETPFDGRAEAEALLDSLRR